MRPRDENALTYRLAMGVSAPIVEAWGRMRVEGIDHVPASGPVLLIATHDSYWDPVVIGVAARHRRQIHALAKSSMWKVKGLSRVLDGMGQIPIDRGKGDLRALDRAIEELRAGACIGVFPEGTRSLGRELRARSGVARLAAAVPDVRLVGCAVTGTTDIPRFPRRPNVRVEFFRPEDPGDPRADPVGYAAHLLAQSRARAPIAMAGRKPPLPAAQS